MEPMSSPRSGSPAMCMSVTRAEGAVTTVMPRIALAMMGAAGADDMSTGRLKTELYTCLSGVHGYNGMKTWSIAQFHSSPWKSKKSLV
jgi:hypothetical protein